MTERLEVAQTLSHLGLLDSDHLYPLITAAVAIEPWAASVTQYGGDTHLPTWVLTEDRARARVEETGMPSHLAEVYGQHVNARFQRLLELSGSDPSKQEDNRYRYPKGVELFVSATALARTVDTKDLKQILRLEEAAQLNAQPNLASVRIVESRENDPRNLREALNQRGEVTLYTAREYPGKDTVVIEGTGGLIHMNADRAHAEGVRGAFGVFREHALSLQESSERIADARVAIEAALA